MPNPPERQGDYTRRHLSINRYAAAEDYGSRNRSLPRIPVRDRADHAANLASQMAAVHAALAQQHLKPVPGFIPDATLLDVAAADGADLPELEKRKTDIRVGNVRVLDTGEEQATLILPRDSLEWLSEAITQYRDSDTKAGKPSMRGLIKPIDSIELGTIESLWTDSRVLPGEGKKIWWECWCWPDRTEVLHRAAAQLRLTVSGQHLFFPEMTVIPVYGMRNDIERIVFSINAVAELRHASGTPRFYVHDQRNDQGDWVDDLMNRISWPDRGAPAVCLLDSGVNRGHRLIAPALPEDDANAYDSAWGTDDTGDHGTNMAGLVLYGDLMSVLGSTNAVAVSHRLESVKIIPPKGFPKTEPRNYGTITQGAIAIPESSAPHRSRIFCCAVSNEDVSGERASSWSSAIDQSVSGTSPGDAPAGDDADGVLPRRLILVAAGNIPDGATIEQLSDTDEFPIEDPAQSWNALSVGGFSNKVDIEEPMLEGYTPIPAVGERSPYSRTSTDWPQSTTPIKPELVFEAGNRALSPDGAHFDSGVDSLSLLTTGSNVVDKPIETFWATSAATAQGARLAAMIQVQYPGLSPETVRALMVHSAQWSPAMLSQLQAVNKKDRKKLLRCFGYGIPDVNRALRSASSDLALIAEATIQPYKRITGKGIHFNHAHFFELPWPTGTLKNWATCRFK